MGSSIEQAGEIFCNAVDIESSRERDQYVESACAGDAELLSLVNQLLEDRVGADAFFPEGGATRISAVEISETLASNPDFFENMDTVLPDDDEVGKQIGNYKLMQKIGEGGGGNVYLAEQVKPVRRQVAFKIIKLGMDTKSVIARFEAERQALAMMEHPNIAHVLNAGATETGRPFFVMELVHGTRITTYCDENQLDIHHRLELFIQVCHAIQHAHQKGIIHRDIKPSNVLITLHDGVPMPKVIDFGIAKAVVGDPLSKRTAYTSHDSFIGTPAYMSPEQANLATMDIDMRSDIYSLGVLLYELLCGHPPFDQKELIKSGVDEMRRILRERDPPRPSVRVQGLSEEDRDKTAKNRQIDPRRLAVALSSELDWVVMKALEKDRDRRYQTVDGFAADVERLFHHEPVLARPPSRRYRFRKLVRRNKGVFASVAAVSITLVAGLGTSSWLFVREREARRSEAVLRAESEVRERITQAAVLLRHGQPEEADQLVGESPVPVIKPSLEATDVFNQLGNWNIEQGRWPEAADRFLKLSQAMQVDKSDMTDNATRDLLRVGPPLVVAGDLENYRHLITRTLSHFAHTRNPIAAEQLIKLSLIVPADEYTMDSLQPLADVVRTSIPADTLIGDQDGYIAWRVLSLSLYEYRMGEFVRAIDLSKQCLEYRDSSPTRIALCHLIQAMAYSRLHQPDKARSEFAVGHALVEHKFPDGLGKIKYLGSNPSGFWYDWIIAYLFQQEARGLL